MIQILTKPLEGNCPVVEGVVSLACFSVILQNLVTIILGLSGIAAVFIIVLSGIKFATSQGDKEKVSSAQKSLTFGIIGFILILFSFFILKFIVVDMLNLKMYQVTQLPFPDPSSQKTQESKNLR